MPADTITSALTFLYSKLSGDATLSGYITGVFQDIAPEGQQPVYCVIGVQSPGLDTLTTNAVRILSRPLFAVKVIGPAASMPTISAAYARADVLIGLVRNGSNGVLACYREAPLYLPEPQLVNGEPWVTLGGLYRIEL